MKNILNILKRVGSRLKEEWDDFCHKNDIKKDFFYLVNAGQLAIIVLTIIVVGPMTITGILLQEITD